MAYTALVCSYRDSFHDAYVCLRYAHYRYRPQLSYKSHKTNLTNHMRSISHHITPLVIKSLGGGHTNTHTHTCIQTLVDRSNSKNQAHSGQASAPGLKIKILCTYYSHNQVGLQLHSPTLSTTYDIQNHILLLL